MIAECDMSSINNNTFNKTKSIKIMISSSLNQLKTFFLFYEVLAIIISIIIILRGKSKIPCIHIQGIDRYTILIQFLSFFRKRRFFTEENQQIFKSNFFLFLKKKIFHRRKLFQNLSRHKQKFKFNHA